MGDSIIALIEENAKVQAAGTVSVMAEGATDIIDIVGSLGVGGNAFGHPLIRLFTAARFIPELEKARQWMPAAM